MLPPNVTPSKFLRPWYFFGTAVMTEGWTRHWVVLQSDIQPLAPPTQLVPVMMNGVIMELPISQLDL